MAHVLLVDDDPDQLEIRKMLFERAGHRVSVAVDVEEAQMAAPVEVVVMDLRLPHTEDGLRLIRWLDAHDAAKHVYVLSGWPADLDNKPEKAMVTEVFGKPVKSSKLIEAVAKLVMMLVLFVPVMFGADFQFQAAKAGEAVAELKLSAAAGEWSVADVTLDGKPNQNVLTYAGPGEHIYKVFLGAVDAGEHKVAISGAKAGGATFKVITPDDPAYLVITHAPILYGREDTIGTLNDEPLLMYTERFGNKLVYTVIFSNEDGGTPTPALYSRWGRTTDIEYIYDVDLGAKGEAVRARIQGKNHEDLDYKGAREGNHPVLAVVTKNNMVGEGKRTAWRFQMLPVEVDLKGGVREQVMDLNPLTWQVMAEELKREGKTDPRGFVYTDVQVEMMNARFTYGVRLKGETQWRFSFMGVTPMSIERSVAARTAVPIKPGEVEEVGFLCLAGEDLRKPGRCDLKRVWKMFRLKDDATPGESFWSLPEGSRPFGPGNMLTWTLK